MDDSEMKTDFDQWLNEDDSDKTKTGSLMNPSKVIFKPGKRDLKFLFQSRLVAQ